MIKKIFEYYKKVWKSFEKYKLNTILLFITIILVALGEGANIAFLIPLLSFITGEGDNLAILKNIPINLSHENLFLALIFIFLIIVIIKNILKVTVSYISSNLVWKIRIKWTNEIVDNYLDSHYHEIINKKQGYLVNNAIEETMRAAKMLSQFILFNSALFYFVGIYLVLISANTIVTLVITFILILILFPLKRLIVNISLDSGSKRIKFQQLLHSILGESINGIKEVKIFQMEHSIKEKINSILKKYKKIIVLFVVSKELPLPMMECIFVLSISIGMTLILKFKGINYLVSFIPTISVFILGGTKLFSYFSQTTSMGAAMLNFEPSYNKVLDLTKKSINKNTPMNSDENNINKIENFENIYLNNINFSYKDKKIFKDLNLKIKANSTTFIVGESGIGKSTLAYMLLGFITPESGKINFDKTKINDTNRHLLRDIVSYVSQDHFLFHTTIKENILLGSNKNISEEYFNDICKITAVDSFIKQIPGRYDCIVGDRGSKFSEGQKQRISLARALAKDSPLFILDEPTSSLDKKTSKILEQMLLFLKKREKTIIVITHKEEDLILADEIIRLEKL